MTDRPIKPFRAHILPSGWSNNPDIVSSVDGDYIVIHRRNLQLLLHVCGFGEDFDCPSLTSAIMKLLEDE